MSPGLFAFIGIGLVLLIWHRFKSGSQFEPRFRLLSLLSLVMALGPALHWLGKTVKVFGFHVPLPYLLAYYLLPGFGGFRTPSRWIVPAAIGALLVGGMGVKALKPSWRYRLMALTLIIGFLFRPPLVPARVPDVSAYPDEYYYLKELPQGVVLELPIFRWGSDDFSKNETWRMLYQTLHKKALVNGYSGFSPPVWEAQVKTWQESSVMALPENITYVLIHEDEYAQWGKPIPRLTDFEEIAQFNNTAIFKKD